MTDTSPERMANDEFDGIRKMLGEDDCRVYFRMHVEGLSDPEEGIASRDKLRRLFAKVAELEEQRGRELEIHGGELAGCDQRINDLLAKVAELEEAATIRMVADAGIGTEPIGTKLKKKLETDNTNLRELASTLMKLVGESVNDERPTIDNLLERLEAKAKDAPK